MTRHHPVKPRSNAQHTDGAKTQGDGKDYAHIINSYQKLINFLTYNDTSIKQIISENLTDKREISKVVGNFYELRRLRNAICHPEASEGINSSMEFVQLLKGMNLTDQS